MKEETRSTVEVSAIVLLNIVKYVALSFHKNDFNILNYTAFNLFKMFKVWIQNLNEASKNVQSNILLELSSFNWVTEAFINNTNLMASYQ